MGKTLLQEEMLKAKVDYLMVIYGGAGHRFTNPESGNDQAKGWADNEKADLELHPGPPR